MDWTGKKKLSVLLVGDIIAMAVLYRIPDQIGDWQVKRVIIIFLALAAIALIVLISRKKEKETHVQILDIDSVSQMNPGQYLSKGGPVCAGSDGRYHVTFLLKDETQLILSLSGKQAGKLAKGMYGTLVHNGAVFVDFEPEK